MKIKTTWRWSYLRNKYGGGSDRLTREWLRALCQKRANMTGVPWASYHARGDAVVLPHCRYRETNARYDPDLSPRLLELLPDNIFHGIDFVKLARDLAIPIRDVMELAKGLEQRKLVHFEIAREGGYLFFVRRARGGQL